MLIPVLFMSLITLLFLNSMLNLVQYLMLENETNSTRCPGHIEKCHSKSHLSKGVACDCDAVVCFDVMLFSVAWLDKGSFLNFAVHFSACICFTTAMISAGASHRGNWPLSSTLS